MHLIYKQDFYEDKLRVIYELFIDHLVPIMGDLDHPDFIEERKQNLDAAAYEKNLNQDVKIPSIKENIDCNNKTEYWPKSIEESLNWLPFLYITNFTADRIENHKKLYYNCRIFFQCLRLNVDIFLGVR